MKVRASVKKFVKIAKLLKDMELSVSSVKSHVTSRDKDNDIDRH